MPTSSNGHGRVENAYGANFARLQAIKRKYDPENVFHHNQNIKP
jgi:FAD/FMN-containing dehydrogenase